MASTRSYRGPRTVCFGEFELDVRAAELRRNGVQVRIQEQPFRLLAMLLEHPGEVVLREEIRKRLWPNDTAVEVSHGINAAVLRLREALADSAENPTYIETVARRGYRFRGQALEPVAAVAEDLSGRRVGHYRIFEQLGSGGMGVVYRGEDEKLGRPVALKFLPPELAAEPSAIGRFHREARAASALNHPNICTVYAVEEHSGRPFIVMEFLEGRTLEAVLANGPLSAERALAIAIHLAAALDAAHRKGIVHRDLKPGNVLLTEGGVKVFDFGLARMPHSVAGAHVTQEGAILGTPNYMSPEQEQGREAGPPSDIYALGLVLREMAGAASHRFDGVLSKCLDRDPVARWQSAADLKAALEAMESPGSRVRLPRLSPVWRRRTLAAAGCVVAAILAAFVWIELVPQEQVTRLTLPANGGVTRMSLSPDGRRVAFSAGNGIFVRSFDAVEPTLLYAGGITSTPFWSPDGRSIAFAGGGKLRTVSVNGGLANVLCDVNTTVAGAWSQDGTILIGLVGAGLFRIPASGGPLTRVTSLDSARGETRHLLPQFLPGGRRFLYIAGTNRPGGTTLSAGSLDSSDRREVMPVEGTAMFVPSRRDSLRGYLVFTRGSSLLAQPFDAGTLRASGEPIFVADSVSSTPAIGATAAIAHFSAAGMSLAYRNAAQAGAGGVMVIQNWMAGLR